MVRCEDWLPSPRTQAKEKSEDPKGDGASMLMDTGSCLELLRPAHHFMDSSWRTFSPQKFTHFPYVTCSLKPGLPCSF